ncbi:hypothetical protein P8452_38454 [Trifolium repens]|nr:hypothetical protein P8452_38454 [Trifolium repens]
MFLQSISRVLLPIHLPCVQISNNQNLQLNRQPASQPDLVSVESLRVTSTFLQILSLVPDLLEKLTFVKYHISLRNQMATNSGKQKIQVKDHTSRKESTSHQMGDALVARAQPQDKIVESSSSHVIEDCSLTISVLLLLKR